MQVAQLNQVMQVRLAHLWHDFRVIKESPKRKTEQLKWKKNNLNMISREANSTGPHSKAVRGKSLERHWTCLGHTCISNE